MADVTTTRLALQQLAIHVLARRRFEVTGRFGLRPSPGGLSTPLFGDEVVRIDGGLLVHERGGESSVAAISTLAAAAELVGTDLSTEFAAGDDTPPLAPIDEPLAIDADHVRRLGAWWTFGVEVIDEVIGTASGRHGTPRPAVSTLQLWPEHFDVGGTVTIGPGSVDIKVNVGASPGDGFAPEPYLYVGPWTDDRPGDAGYWNAPFGAVLRSVDLPADDRRTAAVEFVRQGLSRF